MTLRLHGYVEVTVAGCPTAPDSALEHAVSPAAVGAEAIPEKHCVPLTDKVTVMLADVRAEEAQSTGAGIVLTNCPFCVQMFEDGVASVEPDEAKRARPMDIAELLELTVINKPVASASGESAV